MLRVHHVTEVEQFAKGLEAVVFDLDDTLYLERDYVKSGYAAVAREFPEIPEMEQKLWQAFEAGGYAINQVLEEAGLFNEENLSRALSVYRFHRPTIQPLSGALDMLRRMRESGLRLGIITDGRPDGQRAKLEALGLVGLVDEIIITDELGGIAFRKPNEAAFRLMQQRLGVPFEAMMYVGDNLTKDFIAPEALGMKFCHHCIAEGLYTQKI